MEKAMALLFDEISEHGKKKATAKAEAKSCHIYRQNTSQ